jgi:hypothetical protein
LTNTFRGAILCADEHDAWSSRINEKARAKGETVMMNEKRYFVNEDYPSESWEDLKGLTREAARRVLTDEEFDKWCKERDDLLRKQNEQWEKDHANIDWNDWMNS